MGLSHAPHALVVLHALLALKNGVGDAGRRQRVQAMADGLSTMRHSTKLHVRLDADPAEPIGLHPQDLRLLQKVRLYLAVVAHLGKHFSRFGSNRLVAALVRLLHRRQIK